MLDHIKISTKIIISTCLVFAMFLTSEYMGQLNMEKLLDRANKASAMQQILINILEARRQEKNLLLRNEAKYRDNTLKAINDVKQLASDARQRFQQAENKKLMDDVLTAVDEYEAAFRLVASEVQSGNAQHATLDALDKKMVAAARKAQEACETARKDQQAEMQEAISAAYRANVVFALFFLLAGGIGAFIVIRGIMRSIGRVVEGTRGVSDGSLDISPIPESDTEMGNLGRAFNSMITNISDIVKAAAGTGARVAVSANNIHRVADQISESAAAVAIQAGSVFEASTEVANRSTEVSDNCLLAAQGAMRAKQSAETGSAVVEQTISLMREVSQTVQNSAHTVTDLGERSNQIGAIIGTIKDIADQTNLLALNAAIEAARAGEQGRGFAVVADEVRKLAERTTKATHEISEMIGSIQQETANAVREMTRGTEQAEAITLEAARSGEALADILAQVSELASKLEHISSASEQQSAATEEISSSIQSITATIRVTADEAFASAKAASEMNGIAEELMGNIGKLKVREDVHLAISKAKSAHMIFVGKVKAHLDGSIQLDPEKMPTHQTCAFGNWYQSKGREIFGTAPAFTGIDAPHAKVHALGRQAVQTRNTGDKAKARSLCSQMEDISMELVGLLDQLGKSQASKPAP